MQITKGKIPCALKCVIYGPEGIGKSTFASRFPDPLFSDTEGSTKNMDVARFARPTSWTMLMEQVRYVKANPGICKTYVLDTADWAERLCVAHICAKYQQSGIEAFNYGKGYVYLSEEFGRLLNLLEDLAESGVNVVITAHAKMRKFEQPDEMGSYDRWELKLEKQTAPLVKEWADMVLFATYKTYVVASDDSGKKHKAQGGARVMHTTHHPCWDAKNRHGLTPELPFEYEQIAHCLSGGSHATSQPPHTESAPAARSVNAVADIVDTDFEEVVSAEDLKTMETAKPSPSVPKALLDLMAAEKVTEKEIQRAVAEKGYYPEDTAISNYDPQFIQGVLIGAWPQVLQMIKADRELPFQ